MEKLFTPSNHLAVTINCIDILTWQVFKDLYKTKHKNEHCLWRVVTAVISFQLWLNGVVRYYSESRHTGMFVVIVERALWNAVWAKICTTYFNSFHLAETYYYVRTFEMMTVIWRARAYSNQSVRHKREKRNLEQYLKNSFLI